LLVPDRSAAFVGPSTLHRVEPLEPGAMAEGDRVVVEGVHFLTDGEAVVEVRGR
jgi:hypothetical protein